ncbi:MAG TPA: phenylalanine--tRNA ligase subunit beta [Clostridia bacterium]|nr:phenylalanine--tRNA ligase subunit beta [Clostridia bacterium]
MKLSMKWLSDYVDINVAPKDFSEAMTMTGSKVELFENTGDKIDKVVAGTILSVESHPNADKLVICKLDVGSGSPIQIVTGARNVFAGANVPVALDGSSLPGGVKIRKGKLRGEESNGMMCSIGELGLTLNDFPYAEENGIFIMKEECRPGQDIREVLGMDDTVVEFEITPNRPDCLSVLGLAREVAVTYDKAMTLPDTAVEGKEGKTTDFVTVEVEEPSLCTRYTARAVRNVRIGPSPRWMRERLRAAGVRPINNIVDITNYVMLEYGQPMHAFDYRFIKDGRIHVRRAHAGEKIVTLDGVERTLADSMLVIADENRPVAVAGVMGGEHSGIMDDTNTIVFESAMFDGTSVRLTSKKLGLRSESSARFEKGLDAQNTIPALMRACRLVELLGAGEVCGDMIDVDNSDHSVRTVPLDADWINRFLGTDIPEDFMINALKKLEFHVENRQITVPTYRSDVENKADIAEEVARIYGYNKIPVTMIGGSTPKGGLNPAQKFEKNMTEALISLGFYEVSTYSFISPKYYDKILLPADSPMRKSIRILNPLGEDTSIMRTTTLPSILEVMSRNFSNRNTSAKFFEIGTVYLPQEGQKLPQEATRITMGMFGQGTDFYVLKGAVEELLEQAGVGEYEIEADSDDKAFHPGRCARISIDGKSLAVFGEIHPAVQSNYEMDVRCYAAVIDFELLMECSSHEKNYKPLPKFPAVVRDIALICDDNIPVLELEKAIRNAAKNVLERIELFDIYKGKQIPDGKKSVAFSVTMRAADRTLTDEEADSVMKKIFRLLEKMGAALRA